MGGSQGLDNDPGTSNVDDFDRHTDWQAGAVSGLRTPFLAVDSHPAGVAGVDVLQNDTFGSDQST